MWRAIIRQMWKQRKLNLWVMTGLVLITVVIWFIIDPLFVLCYNRWIVSDGFNADNLYVLSLRQYPEDSDFYVEESDVTEVSDDFHRILNLLKQQPEVDSYAVVNEDGYPFCDWYNIRKIHTSKEDTIGIEVQFLNYYSEGNYFRTFQIRSAIDGSIPQQTEQGMVYVTKDMEELFLGERLIGKELIDFNEESYRVVGIVNDMKVSTYELPGALIYNSFGAVKNEDIEDGSVEIVFRAKENALKGIAFADYRKKMEKILRSNNLYTKIKSFDKVRRDYETVYGITNRLRIQTFLVFFFVLNMLLGIIGTFWFRCRSRQEEIGLRIALGSTRKQIAGWFLAEGFILSTFAVIIGMFIVIQWVWYEGMYTIKEHTFFVGTGYLTDNVILHFLCVFSITYFLILLTVASGAFFPAWIATKVNPAEALQVE